MDRSLVDRFQPCDRLAAAGENQSFPLLHLGNDFLGMKPKIDHGNGFHEKARVHSDQHELDLELHYYRTSRIEFGQASREDVVATQ